jgi:hypothetical protein
VYRTVTPSTMSGNTAYDGVCTGGVEQQMHTVDWSQCRQLARPSVAVLVRHSEIWPSGSPHARATCTQICLNRGESGSPRG